MKCLKVPLREAEKAKDVLYSQKALDKEYEIEKEKGFLYFPLTKVVEGWEVVERKIAKKEREITSLKDVLQNVLDDKEMDALKTAYDVVGDIAIIEISEELESKKKVIGETLLASNKNIKVVLRRGKHEGTYRLQELEWLAGEDRTTTLHKENGVQLFLDVAKTYFSARLSTERKRILEMVKKSERILVMFSGCGVYPVVLAKNKEVSLVGVEINPDAHVMAEENVKKNKLKDVQMYCGDVREVVPSLGEFDRVLMPLPKQAEDFLDVAIPACKKNAVIHLYQFLHEDDVEENSKQVVEIISSLGRKAKIVDVVRCGQQSPHTFRWCLDIEIS